MAEFWVVTTSQSLYHVSDEGGEANVEKIAGKGTGIKIGGKLRNGSHAGIVGGMVILFTPRSGKAALPSYQNIRDWGGHTSAFVGLFLKEKDAQVCLKDENLLAWDPRWKEMTEEVMIWVKDGASSLFVFDPFQYQA